ncbi:MAG: accessory factor UbiK family protein [Alphaproteobacteria bacterium]|nr:accessory factor UbiK family protein [Alphaproteobacteria bacterium]
MQYDHRLIDDLARVAGGALGTLAGIRDEVEARLRQQFERILAGMDLVTREEFEVARAMAQAAREEQEKLAARITELEARLAATGEEVAHEGAKGRRKAKPPE